MRRVHMLIKMIILKKVLRKWKSFKHLWSESMQNMHRSKHCRNDKTRLMLLVVNSVKLHLKNTTDCLVIKKHNVHVVICFSYLQIHNFLLQIFLKLDEPLHSEPLF